MHSLKDIGVNNDNEREKKEEKRDGREGEGGEGEEYNSDCGRSSAEKPPFSSAEKSKQSEFSVFIGTLLPTCSPFLVESSSRKPLTLKSAVAQKVEITK